MQTRQLFGPYVGALIIAAQLRVERAILLNKAFGVVHKTDRFRGRLAVDDAVNCLELADGGGHLVLLVAVCEILHRLLLGNEEAQKLVVLEARGQKAFRQELSQQISQFLPLGKQVRIFLFGKAGQIGHNTIWMLFQHVLTKLFEVLVGARNFPMVSRVTGRPDLENRLWVRNELAPAIRLSEGHLNELGHHALLLVFKLVYFILQIVGLRCEGAPLTIL